MNLVAKEYVAARDDERGVLILSRFAGASRELQMPRRSAQSLSADVRPRAFRHGYERGEAYRRALLKRRRASTANT
jgi:hypothetical protein